MDIRPRCNHCHGKILGYRWLSFHAPRVSIICFKILRPIKRYRRYIVDSINNNIRYPILRKIKPRPDYECWE